MKKFIGKVIFVSLVVALVVWVASIIFYMPYREFSVFVGVFLTIVLLFFNSSGGTSMSNFEASESIWKVQKQEDLKINVGVVFYGSALYTVVSLIILIFL